MNVDGAIVVADSDEESENAHAVTAMAPAQVSASTSRQAAALEASVDKHSPSDQGPSKEHLTSDSTADDQDQMECPICLQTCIHPARLPCGHVFCFLCVKGVAYKNRRCAMCRREIPIEFLDHPDLLFKIEETAPTTDDGFQWFYEGRNGWWQYDERTSQEIEDAYKRTDKFCTILVAGYVYVVDFETMLQQRQNEPTRKRQVKRDLATIAKKGVAGLRIDGTADPQESASSSLAAGGYSGDTHAYSGGGGGGGGYQQHTDAEFGQHSQQPEQQQLQAADRPTSARSPLISTIAATDAAIRIASDIIDSTLAHASNDTHASAAPAAVSTSPSYDYRVDYANQSTSSSSSSDGSGGEGVGGGGDDGGQREDLLSEMQMALNMNAGGGSSAASASSMSTPRLDFFSQTIDEFRSLALSNIAESDTDSNSTAEDDDDDEEDDNNDNSIANNGANNIDSSSSADGERRGVVTGPIASVPVPTASAADDGHLF